MRFHFRLPFKLLALALSLFPCVCPLAVNAQQVSITTPNQSLSPGQAATLTAKITNTLVARPPITLTVGATYQDWTGATLTATPASVTLNVIQPLSFSAMSLTLGSGLTYVPGSAQAVFPVTGTVAAGILTLAFTAPPLTEGQSLSISFGVQVSK